MIYWFNDIIDLIWARPDPESWWSWLLVPLWFLFRLVMRVIVLAAGILFLVAIRPG
mgnify:CR=1 FL=1